MNFDNKGDILQMLSKLLDNRPIRWAESTIGGYDGCERTLEVFNTDAAEQLELIRKIRQRVDSSLVVIFHTRAETTRLYRDFVQEWNNKVRWVDQEVELGESKPHRKEVML